MLNSISLDSTSTKNIQSHSQQRDSSPSLPQEKASVTEIFNQSVNTPKNEGIPQPQPTPTRIKRDPVPVTDSMLAELADAIQYELPITSILRNAPAIINTRLSNGMLPLHFAIHYGKSDAIDLLLIFTDLQLKDSNGFDAFDHAVQMENTNVAKKIMEINMDNDRAAIKKCLASVVKVNAENLELQRTLNEYPEEDRATALKNLKSVAERGFSRHNTLVLQTIAASDYKAFLRAISNGADFVTVDPENRETLLHVAIKAGQEEIIYFLLNSVSGIAEVEDINGMTPVLMAESNKRQDLVDLINAFQNRKASSPEMQAKLEALDKTIQEYREAYIAKVKIFSEKEKEQLHYIAKHGIILHPEGSQGHNTLVLQSIIQHDLERLVFLGQLGFILKSTSRPLEWALEDPMGNASTWRAFKETNGAALKGLKDSVYGTIYRAAPEDPIAIKAPGQGKTLLDMAVYYAEDGENEQKSLEIIAYLVAIGLDPMRINDEGESPLSMALLKGHYKAALLMMKDLEYDEALLHRTYLMLREGARLRDPLAVSSSQKTQGFFAAAYLLTSLYANNGVLSLINFIPFFLPLIGGCFPDMTTYREKLIGSRVKPLDYPELVKHAVPALLKAAILEIAILPRQPIAMLALTTFFVGSSALDAIQSVKTAVGHAADRPLNTAYKLVVDTLPLASNLKRFKSLFSSLFFPHTSGMADLNCAKVNMDDYKNLTIVDRVSDKSLNSKCVDHAKVILGKWDDELLDVNKLYKYGALKLHPDHVRTPELFNKFTEAKETLLEFMALPRVIAPPEAVAETFSLSSIIDYIPYKETLLEAAGKAVVVWGSGTKTFAKYVPGAEYTWPALSIGSIGYVFGKTIYGAIIG